MEVLLIIVPLAFVIGLIFLLLFNWVVNSGQLDDLDTPAKKILLPEEQEKNKQSIN
jgi:cbb3-type cytochrome oxidase maturation protein